jgi:hypothetical protein
LEPKTEPVISPWRVQNSSSAPVALGLQDRLGGGERERAVARDRGGQLERGVDRAARVAQPVDQAELRGRARR